MIPRLLPNPVAALTQHILQIPVRSHQLQDIIHILQMVLEKIHRLFEGLIRGIDNLLFITRFNDGIAGGKQKNKDEYHRSGEGYGELNPHGQTAELYFQLIP